jgi:hypothetical protein
MCIEKVANFGVAMATLGHNIDPSLTLVVEISLLRWIREMTKIQTHDTETDYLN